MKVKTSVTLSRSTLRAVDQIVGRNGNRSAFIEQAVREYITLKQREVRDAKDIAIYTKYADEYKAFAEDVLQYQADPFADLEEDEQ